MTQRELEIINLVAQGRTNKEIANNFAIAEQTVKNHLRLIFRELRVSSRLQLALYALKHGLNR